MIVDLAAEYDLRGYLALGADLTIHSSHKFLGGATAGIVAGRKPLVRAAYLQNFGIARPMKAGKESVAGALAALEAWGTRDHAARRQAMREQLEDWRRCLGALPGIEATIDPDPTGNPFDRLKLEVDATKAGLTALQLVQELERGDPPIAVRSHQIEHGWLVMDPRSLAEGEAASVTDRISEVLKAAASGGFDPASSDLEGWKATKARALGAWPDTV